LPKYAQAFFSARQNSLLLVSDQSIKLQIEFRSVFSVVVLYIFPLLN